MVADTTSERDLLIQKIIKLAQQQTTILQQRRALVDLMRENEADRAEATKIHAVMEAKLLNAISICDSTLAEIKSSFSITTDALTSMTPGHG